LFTSNLVVRKFTERRKYKGKGRECDTKNLIYRSDIGIDLCSQIKHKVSAYRLTDFIEKIIILLPYVFIYNFK